MKRVDTTQCLAHVLVCVNQRPNSELPSCAKGDAEGVYEAFRRWLDDSGLRTRIWLTRTQCMGWCHIEGTTVAIYPEGIWYRAVTADDCTALIDEHLLPLLEN